MQALRPALQTSPFDMRVRLAISLATTRKRVRIPVRAGKKVTKTNNEETPTSHTKPTFSSLQA